MMNLMIFNKKIKDAVLLLLINLIILMEIKFFSIK